MVVREIQSDLESIEKNSALDQEINFERRVEALDYIEFNILDRIEGLRGATDQPEELARLKHQAEQITNRLEEIDTQLFRRLRAEIRKGVCRGTAFAQQIEKYVARYSQHSRLSNDISYDNLDVFIKGLLLFKAIPDETKTREPEMVHYQPSPVRIIFDLVEQATLTDQDVFYDLGSGLGQVPILVNLLSGARAKGIEFEPAFCDYAWACAAELNLSQVEFINVDAREANYSDGTVFFMYTPFEGKMLQQVLDKIQSSRTRRITLFTYGSCTHQVACQSWLVRLDRNGNNIYKPGVFSSVARRSMYDSGQ